MTNETKRTWDINTMSRSMGSSGHHEGTCTVLEGNGLPELCFHRNDSPGNALREWVWYLQALEDIATALDEDKGDISPFHPAMEALERLLVLRSLREGA